MQPVRLTRAQQQALTRERLLAAAERVLAGHGYGGASIELITAEAGYSKGAIYSNFESKEAVFLELLRVYMERDMAELGRIVSLPPHQLSAALSAWLETIQSSQNDITLCRISRPAPWRESSSASSKPSPFRFPWTRATLPAA
jgi:AcrR family transcriptional regulator